ncbi:ead/Ea22-like family protein [Pseudomonas aeruginosa]|uniref:ead/Ea22-like family protein n=1 Tax=Pseudomonas aeruginosa TaxID=287 RepID=UPI001049BBDF|nr:ead/Ea22-like family protein [Pseudomonas aeruginosa]HCE6897276.1 hypothetical protein [Pseudomonas aeruginosa]HCE6903016.1 hypothetical protein [Pseudomonas aeruginosa]HCE7019937.1 hypothetical protein [Pseudomonas aeruginosa]HCE7064520.1 hypothetical protein [Pseudomonas aeruginosa]HCE7347622.1 hypothetical protein [Pseudomonas aeruginosa]
MTDHAELRRLAKAATPGARYQGTDERVIIARNGTIICTVSGAIYGPSVMADAEFLCATDPNTILALLDEIDMLKAENEVLRGALQAVVDDPTWRSNDNTLWPKIIKAMDKGTKQ